MRRIMPFLLEDGVPDAEIPQWTSHSFRRGSAIDILEEHGVAAMVEHGSWSDKSAARPYATEDEQTATSFAAACYWPDFSDDDC